MSYRTGTLKAQHCRQVLATPITPLERIGISLAALDFQEMLLALLQATPMPLKEHRFFFFKELAESLKVSTL